MDEVKLNTDTILQSIKPTLIQLLKDSISNPYTEIKKVPTGPGHYAILCNKPVPNKQTGMIDEKYLWYNGDTVKIRSRLRQHLFKTQKYTATSGIAVELISEQEYNNNCKVTDHNYFKQENNKRYLNGIDSRESKWKDYVFYMAVIESDHLMGALETILRETWHKPVLCQYDKR